MPVTLGAIADDFTGASDLANTLTREGMRTVQVIGVPSAGAGFGDAEAVVIALKSRTIAPQDAVAQSLAALRWLGEAGARQIVFKYCSTFDSTSQGNIGPVADALREAVGAEIAVVCPAFPGNGRTVYQGHLFVGDRLLSESSMKDHPLTPMRDSDLVRLMSAQSLGRVGLVDLPTVMRGPDAIAARLAELAAAGVAYAVTDAISDDDLRTLGRAVAGHPLVTGGSGIALGLPGNLRAEGRLGAASEPALPRARGRAAVLAGSCSAATRGQIAHVAGRWPALKLDPDRIATGEDVVGEAMAFAEQNARESPVLFYASADPDEVAAVQKRYGRERAGEMIEAAFGQLAQRLVGSGFDRLVVAGGETSGAVVSGLRVAALKIGPEIAPGVPWTETIGPAPVALALKSGNFGAPDFFERALEMLPGA